MSCENTQISSHDDAVLTRIFNPNLPYGDTIEESENITDDNEIETEEIKLAKQLEVEGVRSAEDGDTEKALLLFNEAIQVAPERASGYNNRAQALRLKGDVAGALDDLDRAIELSEGRGAAACQAYTQRGLIKKLQGNDESAKDDFQKATNLGGKFAKQLLISMNPYAAMCNQMLAEMMAKIRAGESM